MIRVLPLLCFFFFTHKIAAQDFSVVDEYVANLEFAEDIAALAIQLTKPFDSELEKVRAVFSYVANNISYDCREFHREPEDRKARTKSEILERTFEKQRGLCAGYAILFDELCKQAGLTSEIVIGYARISARPPSPEQLRSNHAWNAVEIDSSWYLLDATWCAGFVDSEFKKFTPHFDDHYFMLNPEIFFRQHWPDSARWQLLPEVRTAEEFAELPHFNKLPPGIQLGEFSPETGFISDDLEVYNFKIQLHGAENVYLTMGSRRMEMTRKEGDFFEYSMPLDRVRGRKFMIYVRHGDLLHGVMQYRLQ